MAKRCEHCSYWVDTVFNQETPSGWGEWFGYCGLTGAEGRSLFFACDDFEPKDPDNAEERDTPGD